MVEVQIVTSRGPAVVEAESLGPFWIHCSHGYPGWTITHKNTGHYVAILDSREQARKVARGLRGLGFWEEISSPEEAKPFISTYRKQILALLSPDHMV